MRIFFLLLSLVFSCASHADQVNLAWDANSESNLTGYRLYIGDAPGNWGGSVNVGNVTTYSFSSVVPPVYIGATALGSCEDDQGQFYVCESGFSNIVYYAGEQIGILPATNLQAAQDCQTGEPMAIAVENVSSITAASRTNTTITAPSGITNGDLLFCIMNVGNSSAPTVTPPAGWSQITSGGYPYQYGKDDPWYVKIWLFYKVASSESGNYTFTHSSGWSDGCIYRISGQGTTPITVTPSAGSGIGKTSTAPSVTTTIEGSLVIFFFSAWDAAGPTSPPPGTTPTFTEYYDPGTSGVQYSAAGILTSEGATGNKSATNNNDYDWAVCVWAAGMVVVDPVSGGGASALPIIMQQMAQFNGGL